MIQVMASESYDVIVVGAGLLGSATAYALTQHKVRTLLIDARKKGHTEGSSHGHSRIVRTIASESAVFAGMAVESFARMQALNTHRIVARKVPALFMTFEPSAAFGHLTNGNGGGAPLTADEIFTTWGIRLPASGQGILDQTSGVLDPAALLDTFQEAMSPQNIRWETEIASWRATNTDVVLKTALGETFNCSRLVLAVGAWLPSLLKVGNADPEVARKLSQGTIERIPLFYFDWPTSCEAVIPVTLFSDGQLDMYAMPEFGPSQENSTDSGQQPWYLKVGFHRGSSGNDPDQIYRTVLYLEERFAVDYMKGRLGLDLTLRRTSVCLYAMPPDLRESGENTPYNELPILGALPRTRTVLLAAYGGGICAKHAVVIGDQISALAREQSPKYNLLEFDPAFRLRLR